MYVIAVAESIPTNTSYLCLQFCNFPCEDPFSQAIERALPPRRTKLPPDPNTPIFVNSNATHKKRDDLLEPPYSINNAAGKLTSHTAYVRLIATVHTKCF